jgi:hypothetical protein
MAVRLAGGAPVRLFWGSPALVNGLPFYSPGMRPLDADLLSAEGRAVSKRAGLLVGCLDSDAPCRSAEAALAGGAAGARSDDLTIRHTFLGFTGPATRAHVTVVPAAAQ